MSTLPWVALKAGCSRSGGPSAPVYTSSLGMTTLPWNPCPGEVVAHRRNWHGVLILSLQACFEPGSSNTWRPMCTLAAPIQLGSREQGDRGSLRLEGNGVRLSQCKQVAGSQDGQPVPPAGPGDPEGPAWPGGSLLVPGQRRLASCMLGSCVPWGKELWPDHVRDRDCSQVQCSPGRSLGNNAALATWMDPELN